MQFTDIVGIGVIEKGIVANQNFKLLLPFLLLLMWDKVYVKNISFSLNCSVYSE